MNYLTIPEVHEKTKVPISTLNLWCRKGIFEGARKFGRDWAIPEMNLIRSPIEERVERIRAKQTDVGSGDDSQ